MIHLRAFPGFLICLALISAAAVAGEFPAPYNSGTNPARPPLSAPEAAASLRLPPGFKATVFAAEPDVQNPIAMTWDAHGRLWIAENYTYAERSTKFEMKLRDRVLIFEDRNGDGRFSSRRVFTDDVQRLTSVEVGLGGVWLMCPPQLLFVPDRDEDGVPDGPAEVVLDGFTIPPENYHNFANGLRFGPDGWLYGRCGGSSPGDLGAPGTPKEQRIPLRGSIWRYHPQRKVVEVLSSGTTNPWGHDWDRHGELFFINTVNGHLWHGITGAHYARPLTIDPNPYTYALIDLHADHWHFDTGQEWQKSRDGTANAHGGGHAHIGMMIYNGDNWPAPYRGKLYTLNYHGRRANQEILERKGSGYIGRHGKDAFLMDDTWFRGIEIGYGPDGGVFVLDWSDTGECHNALGVSRTSGRVYKITHGEPKRNGPADLTEVGGRVLVELQTHANEWFARQARLQLATRAAGGHKLTHAIEDLRAMFAANSDPVVKLRALWTLYSLGAAEPAFLRAVLRHPDEHVRTWAIRLLSDAWPLDTTLSQRPKHSAPAADPQVVKDFVALAKSDRSALVRLALASVLQRLEPSARIELAATLASRKEDAADHNLPLMIWYGLIPLAETAPAALAKIASGCELPVTRKLIARRLAEEIEKTPAALNALIATAAAKSIEFRADLVAGLAEGLNGWRRAPKPAAWDAFVVAAGTSAPAALLDQIRELNLVFGDGRALEDVKEIVLNGKADLAARMTALRALIEQRPPDLQKICQQVLRVRFLNTIAVRGLALFDDPAIGEQLARAYSSFHHSERAAVMETLVSRPAFAQALLTEVGAGRLPRGDITPFHARQIRNLNDPALTQLLVQAWGELRDSAADKSALMAKMKTDFTPAVLAGADKGNGRAVYAQLCGTCHRLYGQGGDIGPDLTGAGRDNLDYLLENIVDPSAVVTADFRISVVKLKDGRTLNGFIAARTTRTLTIRSMTETQTVERADVENIQELPQSMMPEGLLETITSTQRRDLIAYLMHPSQVPLPPQ
jgi:putative membrane-bound dehydrogenase-like protein